MEDTPPKRLVKSDEKLFDIIEVIQENDGAGVTEIAKAVTAAKSTVHSHLATLEHRGYVVKEDDTYRIGLEFLNHGKYAQTQKEIYPLANQKVQELAEETGEVSWCIVEENGLGYYLCGAKGDHPIHPPVRVGQRIYLHQVSAGKAILSQLPRDRVDEIIERHGLPERTNNTITDVERLKDELDTIETEGVAFNRGESLEGLFAIGAPVITEGKVHCALSISGPAKRVKENSYQERLIDLLLGAVNELEINVMYSN